jgi:polysaccharide export outer membrane protein
MKLQLMPAFGLSFLLISCGAPKDVLYFQNIDSMTGEQKVRMYQSYTSQICPDDMLSITVTSKSPDVATPFNPPLYSYANPVTAEALNNSPLSYPTLNSSLQLTTYPVNNEGNINFPVIGKLHVAGLSKQELEGKLQNELLPYVPDAIVHVKIENFKVTVLGEVLAPGVLPVLNERISILEAIGQAGDLSINGNRKNVLVIRDNNGQKEYGRVNLTNSDVFTSPYYYLRQNDIVYVEPNKAKQKSARYSQGESFTTTVYATIVSGASTIVAIVIAISNATKKN